jgi:hypothetical protein
MTLSEKQRLFMRLLPDLIDFIHEQGYECTIGDGFRDPRSHGAQGVQMHDKFGNVIYGRPKSAHKHRLAIDINLFKNGKYLTETEDHRLIGEYWESLHFFDDGNHYSLVHQGIK